MENVSEYALRVETDLNFEQAIEKVTGLLKEQGFGVLTEIDVKETFKKKIDVDFKPYRILGACNPPFAHKALTAEEHIGVLLPCNVAVWDEGDKRVIAAMDPRIMSKIVDNPTIKEVAEEVYNRILKVLDKSELC